MLRRRADIAFGLLSIAIVRLIRAHPGLNWAGSMPGEGRHGRARKETRDSNGAETRVRSDFVFATIQDGPFIEFDNRQSRLSAGGDKRRHMILSVSLSRVTGVLEDRSTQPSPLDPPSDSAMPNGIKIITDRLGHLARCRVAVP
jgi:hypothetical protein